MTSLQGFSKMGNHSWGTCVTPQEKGEVYSPLMDGQHKRIESRAATLPTGLKHHSTQWIYADF